MAAVELKEYDKELEKRLFPLDEVELRRRRKENADGQKDFSIERLSMRLEISAEVLERTKEVASGALSTPEYWQDWYGKKLATGENAKRANRNFKETEPRPSSLVAPTDVEPQHYPRGEVESALPASQGEGRVGLRGQDRIQDVASKPVDEVNISEKDARLESRRSRGTCVLVLTTWIPKLLRRRARLRGTIPLQWRAAEASTGCYWQKPMTNENQPFLDSIRIDERTTTERYPRFVKKTHSKALPSRVCDTTCK
ncbi:hypothetical protein PC121_g18669 [Phytophthora cactorum]|nr:hypothetical protein PC120_g17557 [Phytophthora cactorum]KAG3049930.1 hypothetical protein PC121_g18669 [Phytophthora cactorum]KAG4046285.1 hypothetical protein PC123_g18332 [Phytophthora cactorum]